MKARKKSELIDLVKIDRVNDFMNDAYILLLSDGTYRKYNTKQFYEHYEIVED